MKINKIKINSFGKLRNKEIKFKNGINILYGENESGKSTIMNFIKNTLYGISKNKKGKEISDYDKYKPWGKEEFSGKLEYTLDNNEKYEIYRDFNKKNPKIYNENSEDISKEFNINKKTGNEFFYEQTKVDEELFLSTVGMLQSEIKLEKNNQNILVQKLANLASTGDDNVSYKRAIERINRRQLDEIGTDRSKEKPINLLKKQIQDLEINKINLEQYQNKKYEIEENEKKLLNDLNNKYNLVDTTIDKTNYYNLDNISSLIDVVTNEYNLELLNISINTYLERRPSDTLVINNLLSNINEKRVTLNKEVTINYLEGMVNNTDLTNEDNVDKLYKLTYLNFIKEETKEKIYNAKLSFYSFDLKDKTNYDYEIYKEYFIINTLTKIDENELINNISYDYRYLVKYSNEKLELTLFDKNDNLIRTYEIIIKGDLNNDKNLDYTDIELFRDKLLKNEEIKEIDLIKLDFNKDNEVTFDDLVLARDKVNNIIQIGDTTEASYVITKTKEDNKVYYTVTLKTDGKVTGLVFDLNTSSNLSFDSITYLNDKLNIDDIIKPTKLIGLDDFTNDERLITICYTDTKDMEEDIIFNIIESITYLDSKEKITINEISSVIPKKIVNDNIPKQEETKVIYVDNNVNNDDNSSDEPSKDNKPTNDNKNDNNKDVKEDNENLLPNIIKIVVIVLLGTLIVYFMNKNEKEEEINFDDKKEEK